MLANFAPVNIRLPCETCQLKSDAPPFFHPTAVFRTVSNNPRWHATKFQFILKAFFAGIMIESAKASCHSHGTICIDYYPQNPL